MTIAERIRTLKKEIALIKQSPLAASAVELMGVTKGQSVENIEEAIHAGLWLFGENRVQEAKEKWPDLKIRYPKARLHLIGPLQTNKVKEALALFDIIETVDRPKLAEEISRCRMPGAGCQEFFIQVNTGKEPQKGGVIPEEAEALIYQCRQLQLPVTGLMCIPPADQPTAPHFALLRKIAHTHGLERLSMGMSEDYKEAVRMGSTCVRIGRGIFGERN